MPALVNRALVALAAAAIAHPAAALTDSNFTYSAYLPGYVEVTPFTVTPQDIVGVEAVHTRDLSSGLTSEEGCFVGSVYLPQDAWLFSVEINYATTAGAANNLYVEMNRFLFPNHSYVKLFNQYIHDSTGTRKKLTIPITDGGQRQVRNDLYAYGFMVCLETGDTFYGARVNYHYNSAGQ